MKTHETTLLREEVNGVVKKKQYQPPVISEYGSIKDITKAPGKGDADDSFGGSYPT